MAQKTAEAQPNLWFAFCFRRAAACRKNSSMSLAMILNPLIVQFGNSLPTDRNSTQLLLPFRDAPDEEPPAIAERISVSA